MKKYQASWEDLPSPLLELILACLPVSDYFRFAGVCTSWRDVQQDHRLRIAASPLKNHQMPWLPWLMFPIDDESPHPLRHFYDSSENFRSYRLPLPEVQGKRYCCGTSHGWLLLLDVDIKERRDETVRNKMKTRVRNRIRLIIVNPLTGCQIMLRVPVAMINRVYGKVRVRDPIAFLSGAPTDPDCVVLLWDCWTAQLLCRVSDKKWSKCYLHDDYPAICGSRFYIGFFGGKILSVIDLKALSYPPTTEFLEMEGLPKYQGIRRQYLVESEGQILLTIIFLENNSLQKINVYKADLSRKKWMLLKSLGDRMLFLGVGHHFSLAAAANTGGGGTGNRIYFVDRLCLPGDDNYGGQVLIVYDYGSQRVICSKPLHQKEKSGWESSGDGYFRWMVPSLC